MAVKVSDLLEESAQTSVQIGGQSVGLVYRVLWEEQFSEDAWEAIKALAGREYLVAIMPKLLRSWELTDDGGAEIPVTAEAIAQHQVPTRFLRLAEKAVLEAQEAPKDSAASSPATSQPAAT